MKVFQKYSIKIPFSQGKLHLNVEDEAWLSVRHQEESWPSASLDCNSQAQHTVNESLWLSSWLSSTSHSGSKSTWNVIFHSWKSRRIDTFQGRSSQQWFYLILPLPITSPYLAFPCPTGNQQKQNEIFTHLWFQKTSEFCPWLWILIERLLFGKNV